LPFDYRWKTHSGALNRQQQQVIEQQQIDLLKKLVCQSRRGAKFWK
jgi:hypothetical protein